MEYGKGEKMIYMCGHFAGNSERFDGQTIKTRLVFDQLIKKYGEKNVKKIDTCGWKKRSLFLLIECIKAARSAGHIIVMPSMNGVKIFVPLFVRLKEKYNFQLHYVVIGGWICDIVQDNKRLERAIRRVDCIYLENHKTIDRLRTMGLNNVCYMANFKDLKKTSNIKRSDGKFRCCIFSRVEKLKGILDAIDIVDKYNDEHDEKIYLDIYGKIKNTFKSEFIGIIDGNRFIDYLGTVESDRSVEVIEKYDLLLFPTKYATEGIPGTIIDAYFAGVPVLASKWENFDEIVSEGVTGFGYEFGDNRDFYKVLIKIAQNKKVLSGLRENCLKRASDYVSEYAIKPLINNLGE